MPYYHNKNLTENARKLRNNMTQEERKLWHCFLKSYEVRFLRQKVIENYIVDFYCSRAKLIIELDGSQHFENSAVEYDKRRNKRLESLGFRIIRIPNNLVNQRFREVCEYIDIAVKERLNPPGR